MKKYLNPQGEWVKVMVPSHIAIIMNLRDNAVAWYDNRMKEHGGEIFLYKLVKESLKLLECSIIPKDDVEKVAEMLQEIADDIPEDGIVYRLAILGFISQ